MKAHNAQALIDKGQVNFLSTASQLKQHYFPIPCFQLAITLVKSHQRTIISIGSCQVSYSLFAWLISHQPALFFSQNKPATSNQPAVLFSQNKSAPAINHQPNEQGVK
jgi:hypothetical protein